MLSNEDFYKKIIDTIQNHKKNGVKIVYMINEKCTDSMISFVKARFIKDNVFYRMENRKCASCSNTFDIIIYL